MSPRHRQPVDASARAHGRQLAPAPRRRPWAAWLAAVAIAGAVANAHAAAISQTDIVGPPGSGAFGSQIVPLPNGNAVGTDPTFSGVANGIGAVYLFGGSTQDRVGNCGVVALTNGNYVVASSSWDDGATPDVGAVTWVDGAASTAQVVSAGNSLTGATAGDIVGAGYDTLIGLVALANGRYAVGSAYWTNPAGPVTEARAATLGDGDTGTVGVVSAANSVLGNVSGDIFRCVYEPVRDRLWVSRMPQNLVTVTPGLEPIFTGDFEDGGLGAWTKSLP